MLKKIILALAALFATISFAFADVDVNKADQAALDGVKGIGPAKSKAIFERIVLVAFLFLFVSFSELLCSFHRYSKIAIAIAGKGIPRIWQNARATEVSNNPIIRFLCKPDFKIFTLCSVKYVAKTLNRISGLTIVERCETWG